MNSRAEHSPPVKPISAVDAIAPAFRRTRSILAAPFRLGFFLKICFFVALAESGFVSASFSYPVEAVNLLAHGRLNAVHGGSSFLADGMGAMAGGISLMIALLILVLAAVGLAAGCVLAYLFCRLRFTVLDLAIYREGSIGRAWRKYGRQAWRYFGLSILVGLVWLLVAAAILGPFIPALLRIARSMDAANPDPFAMLGLLFPLIGAVLLLSLLGVLVDALIRDFLLPPMAVEDAPLEEALRRFFGLLREDFGSVALYLLLRFVVSFALSVALGILFLVPVAILGLLAFAVGTVLYHALWTGGAQFFVVAYAVAAAAIVLLLYFLGVVAVFGVNGFFKQCYAVIFFGSRYPALGDLLEPPPSDGNADEGPPPPPLPPESFPETGPPPVW